ncbi:MAG: transglutaminase domain-containing protein [Pirellulaceae bacterium]|nr:transglutaminase domain-containing protein [Pirellulaceae bacterium]
MDRRTFLASSAAAAAGLTSSSFADDFHSPADTFAPHPPAFAVIPVVGDGKWIWTEPPKNQTGYLEPRLFELSIGIELQGTGNAGGVMASTPVPLDLPEQKVEDVRITTEGCAAEIRRLAPEAGQLFLAAAGIARGQIILAQAVYTLTLFKQYHAFEKEQFSATQKPPPKELRLYLGDSPGIQTRDKAVKDLAAKLDGQLDHPWDKAKAFHTWVWENITARIGPYTNVLAALKDRVGDCEERAAVFVALCRASGIPARLVWLPNHNWAEFYLTNEQGKGHWIPAHTSCYSWFGWTGAHELVLQKGDNIRIPELGRPQRLLEDWMRRSGAKPEARYFADLKPLPPTQDANNQGTTTADPGPGERSKSASGEWLNLGKYAKEKFVRR